MEQTVEQVRPESVDELRDWLIPLFDSANHYFLDLLTADSIIDGIKDGTKQCFVCDDSVIVSEVTEYPNGKVLNIVLVAGKDADKWLSKADAFFTEMAKLNGCKAIITTGRIGWKKLNASLGYKMYGEYRKEIT